MATMVEISIAGRGDADAPLLSDLIEQIQDFFAMVHGVSNTLTGNAAQQFDWRVVGLSKNSPARLIVEAVPFRGHVDGPDLAAEAADVTAAGLMQLISTGDRPAAFDDNVIDAADRFLRRMTRGLTETTIATPGLAAPEFAIGTVAAVEGLRHIERVREVEPVHPYRELGSFEGFIQNVGADGWGRPFIIIRSRLTGVDVKCFVSGDALRALEDEPVADVVWRNRRVIAQGILKYRSVGKLSQAEVSSLDFVSALTPQIKLADIVDPDFTAGLSSSEYLERLRDGEG